MIRRATPDDLPRLLELAALMHAESRFRVYRFVPEKVEALLAQAIEGALPGVVFVAERDQVVVGGAIGLCTEQWFSDQLVAQDLAIFMDPRHRGGMAAARLIAAFVEWAGAQGAVTTELGINTGVEVERTALLYGRLGLRLAAHLYVKEN